MGWQDICHQSTQRWAICYCASLRGLIIPQNRKNVKYITSAFFVETKITPFSITFRPAPARKIPGHARPGATNRGGHSMPAAAACSSAFAVRSKAPAPAPVVWPHYIKNASQNRRPMRQTHIFLRETGVPAEKRPWRDPNFSLSKTLANRSLKASLVQREVARDSVTEGL